MGPGLDLRNDFEPDFSNKNETGIYMTEVLFFVLFSFLASSPGSEKAPRSSPTTLRTLFTSLFFKKNFCPAIFSCFFPLFFSPFFCLALPSVADDQGARVDHRDDAAAPGHADICLSGNDGDSMVLWGAAGETKRADTL